MPHSIAVNHGSRRSNLCLAILGLVFSVFLCACQQESPPTEPPIRPVRTQLIKITDSKNPVTAVGEIKPRYEANIGFRIPGKIAARPIDIGSVVQKGDLIAKLDSAIEQTAVAIAEAEVRAVQAELADATGQEARQRELVQRGYTTHASYDNAERRLKLAKAKFESAELAKKNALERLSYSELRSDDTGIVTAVGAEPGQVVATGQMVVRIARIDAKEAEFKVAERILRSTPADTPVVVTLLGDPSIKASGRVREVATTADPITRTFAVRVALSDAPEAMRFGATVQGRIVLADKGIIRLPSSALFQSKNGPAVWVFDPSSSKVKLRTVTILSYEVDQVLVTEGLHEGERVVTAGVQKLWPGMKVRLL